MGLVPNGNPFNTFQYGLSGNVLEAVLFNANLYNNMNYLANAIMKGTHSCMKLKGRNPAGGTTLCDLWGYQGTAGVGATAFVRQLWTTAQNLAVVSDSGSDTGTMGVWYLDANFLPHYAVFTLNGTTAVTSATSIDGSTGGTVTAMRVNHSEMLSAANVGNIYVTAQGGQTYTAGVPQLAYASWNATTQGGVTDCILAGDSVSTNFNFTVPAGYSATIISWTPSLSSVGTTQLYGHLRKGLGTGPNGIVRWSELGGICNATNPDSVLPQIYELIPSGADILLRFIGGATNSPASCESDLLLWPNVG